ncbi:MAG: hypothetical protein ABFS05_11915, partial [Bacteroidota bacterium]
MKYFVSIVLMICCMGAMEAFSQYDGEGNVKITQDPRIDTILMKHIEMNEALLLNDDNYAIDGFRIQVFEE